MAIKTGSTLFWRKRRKAEDEQRDLPYSKDEHDDDDDNHSSLAWHLDKFPDPSVSFSLPTRSFSPSSEHSSFTASPEWRESGSSHITSVLSALIRDVEALSEGLDEIQTDIRSLSLSKHLRSPRRNLRPQRTPKAGLHACNP
jgi:hypothetical protein